MEYLVIKQYNDDDCYIVDPKKLLFLEEAQSLKAMFERTDPNRKYIIMRAVQ